MSVISVIVPVYKVEAYLGRCVDSILSQTFRDFELILVDDGSPDRCGALCDAYAEKDSRIHVIHQENGGLSAARNSGIDWVFRNSDSQWLAFVDSDDWVHPEYLHCLYNAVDISGNQMSTCHFYQTEGENLDVPSDCLVRSMSAEDYYCGGNGVVTVSVCKLYHRSLFEALRYPHGKLHEDEFTTYLAVYAAGMIAVTEAPLYAYYQNPAGIMQSKWNPRRMHVLEAVEGQIAFARKNGFPKLLRKAIEQYIYSADRQLEQASKIPEYRSYCQDLRRKLRWGLKLGRESGVFSRMENPLWFYEKAYPVKPFWWLYFKVRKS